MLFEKVVYHLGSQRVKIENEKHLMSTQERPLIVYYITGNSVMGLFGARQPHLCLCEPSV